MGPGGRGRWLFTSVGYVAFGIACSGDDFRSFSLGVPDLIAFTAYGLLVVVYDPALFIANFDGIRNGWLG